MEIENRLKTLAAQVKIQRQNGAVRNWSDKVKKEAVLLMCEVGIFKLIDSTHLPRSLIYVWRDKFKRNKIKINKIETINNNLLVTRITPNNEFIPKNKPTIIIIEKSGIKVKLNCKNTAIDILERFLK